MTDRLFDTLRDHWFRGPCKWKEIKEKIMIFGKDKLCVYAFFVEGFEILLDLFVRSELK